MDKRYAIPANLRKNELKKYYDGLKDFFQLDDFKEFKKELKSILISAFSADLTIKKRAIPDIRFFHESFLTLLETTREAYAGGSLILIPSPHMAFDAQDSMLPELYYGEGLSACMICGTIIPGSPLKSKWLTPPAFSINFSLTILRKRGNKYIGICLIALSITPPTRNTSKMRATRLCFIIIHSSF